MAMLYHVTISSENADEIKLDTESKVTLSEVKIMFDTIDNNVIKKGAGMLARITIKGTITDDEKAKGSILGLFYWSKSEDSDEWYRTVDVSIMRDKDKPYRKYRFERMFVVDYTETYTAATSSSQSSQETTVFELVLTQDGGNFETITSF